ncbi:MAG TPA: thioredoxin-dependent thiol peroxidase [Candidatus Paceibacterota bacterium]|nr:thioredoxin-dependent thiol peroxidase [Candidatus Paceibacterota bacterium]
MSTLKIGKLAPNFTLTDQNGTAHTLKNDRGNWVLIYFYPKDNTPGCTKQACAIRDEFPKFKRLKCLVYGISVDSEKSHKKFEEKFNLPFTLLADTDKKVVESYGVWQEKKMMGRTYLGAVRTSFLINPEGKIAKIYTDVKPETHADEVLTDLKILTKATK